METIQILRSDDSSDDEDWLHSVDSSTTPLTCNISRDTCEHGQVIVHIDIDCFYAQVEMIRNPELRGKPLGIQQKNIIVTSNYEARARGVGKLMYLKEAKKVCPELCIVNGEDLTHYREMSYKITGVLTQYSGLVERLGFDENFVDVTGLIDLPPWRELASTPQGFVYGDSPIIEQQCRCRCVRKFIIASHIAAEMRKTLHTELGITCCAGVAQNKLLAKLVGGTHKPNQQTVLYPDSVGQMMGSIQELRKIPGFGHKTCQRLEALGVSSVSVLQSFSMETLTGEFGPQTARMLHNLSHGVDDSKVITTGKPQSISDEDSFRRCDNVADVRAKLSELIDNLIRRLDVDGRIPQTMRISVRKLVPGVKYPNRQSKQGPIPPAVFSKGPDKKEKLLDLSVQLFHKLVDVAMPFHLTLINVCVLNFSVRGLPRIKKGGIGSFFTSPTKTDNRSLSSQKEPSCLLKKPAVVETLSHSGAKKDGGVFTSSCPTTRNHPNDKESFRGTQNNLKISKRTSSRSNDTLFPSQNVQTEAFLCKTALTEKPEACGTVNYYSNNNEVDSYVSRDPCFSATHAFAHNVESVRDTGCYEYTKSSSSVESVKNETSGVVVKCVPDTGCNNYTESSSLVESGENDTADAVLMSKSHELPNTPDLCYLKCNLSDETEFQVFIELPLEIQKELILAQKTVKSVTVIDRMLNIVTSLHAENSGCRSGRSTLRNNIQTESSPSHVSKSESKKNLENLNGVKVVTNDTPTSRIYISENTCRQQLSNNNASAFKSQEQENKAMGECDYDNEDCVRKVFDVSESDGIVERTRTAEAAGPSETIEIPPEYDPSVFKELPLHVQKTLLLEYKTSSEFRTMRKRKLDSNSPSYSKNTTKRKTWTTSSDIANFFKKR